MGKMIESIIQANNHHEIVSIISSKNKNDLLSEQFKSAQAVIDFSQPDAVLSNAEIVLSHDKPLIIGTTGWNSEINTLQELCIKNDGCVVYASNFSTVVNLFFELNDFLAALMKNRNEYSVRIDETHHTQKKDAPSGTAITLANSIIGKRPNFIKWVNGDSSNKNELPIFSHRIEGAVGEHSISYNSIHDEISIRHKAFDRVSFAEGSILAAEWAIDKKGFYSFREVVNRILKD